MLGCRDAAGLYRHPVLRPAEWMVARDLQMLSFSLDSVTGINSMDKEQETQEIQHSTKAWMRQEVMGE